jgi:hypothetical protein
MIFGQSQSLFNMTRSVGLRRQEPCPSWLGIGGGIRGRLGAGRGERSTRGEVTRGRCAFLCCVEGRLLPGLTRFLASPQALAFWTVLNSPEILPTCLEVAAEEVVVDLAVEAVAALGRIMPRRWA